MCQANSARVFTDCSSLVPFLMFARGHCSFSTVLVFVCQFSTFLLQFFFSVIPIYQVYAHACILLSFFSYVTIVYNTRGRARANIYFFLITYTNMHAHTFTYVYVYTCVYTNRHICMHMYIVYRQVHTHVYSVYIGTLSFPLSFVRP